MKYSRVVSAFAILLGGSLAVAARAAEQPIEAALAPDPPPTPKNTPPDEGSSSGVRINPSNATVSGQTLAEARLPEPPRSGPLYDAGSFLLEHGINLHPTFIDHFGANPDSGVAPGYTNNLGIFSLNADIDLGRLAQWRGGALHVAYVAVIFKSDNPLDARQTGGLLTGFQTTPVFTDSKVSLFTYEQKLLDGRLSVEAGRTNLYRYFLLNNSLDPFNSVSSTFNVVADAAPFMNPTWGGRIKYNLSKAYYVQAGAFEDDWRRSLDEPGNLDTNGASGVQTLAELGYRTEFNTTAYPGNFEVGAEYNDRSGYSNFKGTARAAQAMIQAGSHTVIINFTATDYSGGAVLFAQGKQVLWRGADNPGGQPQNIAIYGSADLSLAKPQPIDFDAIGGVDFTGFIPGRPADALEFQIRYQRLSQLEAQFETRSQITASGSGPDQPRNNFAFQVTGNVQLNAAMSLRPFLQYFVDPDSYYAPTGRSHGGWGAGLNASISIGRLLGLSPL